MHSEDPADPVRLDTRLAGQIKRYHTWPIIGGQTIADHCWNFLRIYLMVDEEPDIHLVREIMFHDIGEHYTGDPPYPMKRDNPSVKESLDRLEHWSYATQLEHWNAFFPVAVSPEDRILLKQIEHVEFAEFGMDQILLGNNHGMIVADRCLKAVYNWNPPPCPRLADYVTIRLKLFYRQYLSLRGDHSKDEWWNPLYWEVRYGGKRDASWREPLQDGV